MQFGFNSTRSLEYKREDLKTIRLLNRVWPPDKKNDDHKWLLIEIWYNQINISFLKILIRPIIYLLAPVYNKDNTIKTRAILTPCIKNGINIYEQIDKPDFNKYINSLLTITTIIKKMLNHRKIVA